MQFAELTKIIQKHNTEKSVQSQFEDKEPLYGYITFRKENWPGADYSKETRTYTFRSDNKYFLPNMCGKSLYGDCQDGSESGIRLDWYLGDWKIEDCGLLTIRN